MTIKLYVSVGVESAQAELDGKHVTVAFLDVAETEKLALMEAYEELPLVSGVQSVEYWEGANVTVALLHPETWSRVKEFVNKAGFTYTDHEFRPHVTIDKGNKVDNHRELVGKFVSPRDLFVRVKNFD